MAKTKRVRRRRDPPIDGIRRTLFSLTEKFDESWDDLEICEEYGEIRSRLKDAKKEAYDLVSFIERLEIVVFSYKLIVPSYSPINRSKSPSLSMSAKVGVL